MVLYSINRVKQQQLETRLKLVPNTVTYRLLMLSSLASRYPIWLHFCSLNYGRLKQQNNEYNNENHLLHLI